MNFTDNNSLWQNPLPGCVWSLPLGKYSTGGFGSRRKNGIHAGVDLYCPHNQPLSPVEDGIVVSITDFSKNKSPWLNRTRVILIEGESGVVAYCNVRERKGLSVGDLVDAGEYIGNVISISKTKRKNNKCMLHLELYEQETKRRAYWNANYPKPPHLLDPTNFLVNIITKNQATYRRTRSTTTSRRIEQINTATTFRQQIT